MKKMVLLSLLVFAIGLAAEELRFGWGKCAVGRDGSIVLTSNDGRTLDVSACVILPKWRFFDQKEMTEAVVVRENSGTVSLRGKLRAGGRLLPFEGRFSVADDVLSIRLSCRIPRDLETQDRQGMMLCLGGKYDFCGDGLLRFGNTVARFGASNVWGNGKSVLLQPFALEAFQADSGVYSLWSNPKEKTWSLRRNTSGKEEAQERLYSAEWNFRENRTALQAPVDMVALKREQYRRLVYPPSEPQFDPAGIRRMLDSKDLNAKEIGRIEDLLDARGALYAWQDRLNHLAHPPALPAELLKRAWSKLNAGDPEGVRSLYPELDAAFAPLDPRTPLTGFNPYSWIKAFTQNGFIKHPEGVMSSEPNPWCIVYQDGFRFRVAGDPGVSIANTQRADPNFFETRFTRPMESVKVERSWVDTRWILPGQTVRFSVLTPMIDVADTDTLTLSGFSAPPDSLHYVTPEGQGRSIPLRGNREFQPEVIASILCENQARPEEKPAPAGNIAGMRRIDPAQVGRPWLNLRSASGWNLILLPGARPVEAGMKDGSFVLKMARKSYVGIVRLPPFLHFREVPAVAEFFAGIAAAYPAGCFESIRGDAVEWSYRHDVRPNDWGLAPHRIAPVSPLAVLAGVSIPELRKFENMTKYGPLSYVEGDRVSFRLPETARRLPMRRGVNAGLDSSRDALLEFKRNGVGWIRLYLGDKPDEEATYRKYEELLKFCSEQDIPLLVDPHNFRYKVQWRQGFPADPAAEQRFIDMWDRLSAIGAKYPKAIAGYDLYNELGVKEGAEMRWKELAARCAAVIAENHPGAMIYMTGMDGANPSGYFNFQPLDAANMCGSFHFYTPHSFTHQKSSTRREDDPFVFYPGYAPQIDWAGKIHYGGTTVDWFDKWTLGATLLPVFELYAKKNIPVHCGEFSVIGYANRKAPMGAWIWTRDTVELFEHGGIPWHLWNGGFGMGNPRVRQLMYDCWKKNGVKD